MIEKIISILPFCEIAKIRIEEAKRALNMFEAVVNEATEYKEIEVDDEKFHC